MRWRNCQLLATSVALLLSLGPIAPTYADGVTIDVVEVRSEGFPRLVARLKGSDTDDLDPDVLTRGRLHVIENGQPQQAAELMQIRNPAVPTSVALALDVSGSMADEDKLAQAQAAAKRFIQQMRPRDQVALLSFGDHVMVPQKLTRDRNLLALSIDKLAPAGNTRLYDAVAQSVTQLSLSPSGARALVVLTDGLDTASERTLQDDIAQALRPAVPVYAIGLGSDADAEMLQQLAAATGGRYYSAPTGEDLTRVFRLISRQLTSQYEVSWVSSSHPVGGTDVPVQIRIETDTVSTELSFKYTTPVFGRTFVERDNPVQELAMIGPAAAPSQQQVLMAGSIAAVSVVLLFLGLVRKRVNRRLYSRLRVYVAGQPDTASLDSVLHTVSTRRGRVHPLVAAAARVTARLVPNKQVTRLRRKLVQAGHASDRQLRFFLAAELTLAVLLGIGAFEVLEFTGFGKRSPVLVIALVVMLAGFGMYLPYMWLRRRVEWRQRMLLRTLPDALDLMSISVTAGLSLDSAMSEVVDKWEGQLSREFNQVLNEMRMGASRREALRNLAERTQLEDVQLLVAALLQADELGTNLSEALSVQAEQLRVRRRQVAEEKARKAPVKMLVPLVLFIFPAIFVVVLAPALIQIFGVLGSLAHRG